MREIECGKCGDRGDQVFVRGKYQWPSIKDSSKVSKNCPSCQRGKYKNSLSPVQCKMLAKLFA